MPAEYYFLIRLIAIIVIITKHNAATYTQRVCNVLVLSATL